MLIIVETRTKHELYVLSFSLPYFNMYLRYQLHCSSVNYGHFILSQVPCQQIHPMCKIRHVLEYWQILTDSNTKFTAYSASHGYVDWESCSPHFYAKSFLLYVTLGRFMWHVRYIFYAFGAVYQYLYFIRWRGIIRFCLYIKPNILFHRGYEKKNSDII